MKSQQASDTNHSSTTPSKLETFNLDFEYNRTLTEERSMTRKRTVN